MKHTMKHLFKPLATALAAALQFAATAAVPLVWDVVPTRATPAKFDRYHGETLELKATFRGFGTLPFAPGADVRLYYQTNGMGAAWWNAPASVSSNVVTGTFSPNLDPGADSVTVFFGAPSNAYASAIIKLRPSPGFSPAAMPAPGIAGVVSLENYYTKDEVESKIAELAPTPGNYETVSNKAMSAVQPEALSDKRDYSDLSVNTNAWLLISPDGGMEWMEWNAVAYGGCWATLLFRQSLRWEAGQWEFVDATFNMLSEQVAAPADATSLTFTLDWYGYPMTYRLHRGTRLALAEEIPSPPDLTPYATKTELGDVASDLADLRTESALVYRLYSGSNVVAEVTNYNSAVHAPELRLMQLNESNEYFTVWAETNGLARTLAAAKNHTDSATNELKNIYAPRAWSRTTSGLGYDAPSNTTWISTEKLVIASGQEYMSIDSAGVWVLCANGQVDFSTTTNSYFSLSTQSGEPVFSVERTDSMPVPVYADGITVRDEGDSKVITVPVPIFDATANRDAPPYLNVATDIHGTWYSETNGIPASLVTSCRWDGQNGAWTNTVVVPATHQAAFFTYHKWQAGGTVIRNKAALDISQGIWVNGTKFVPSVSGNNLIWTKQ